MGRWRSMMPVSSVGVEGGMASRAPKEKRTRRIKGGRNFQEGPRGSLACREGGNLGWGGKG